MELMKWTPRENFLSLHNHFSNLFDDFLFPILGTREPVSLWNWNPAVDIYNQEDSIVIKAELPGVDKKDIQIDVKDNILTLKGERATDNEVKEDNYYHRERTCGKFERMFTLPANIDPENITAEFKDGVLRIGLPKPEEHKPKKIAVH